MRQQALSFFLVLGGLLVPSLGASVEEVPRDEPEPIEEPEAELQGSRRGGPGHRGTEDRTEDGNRGATPGTQPLPPVRSGPGTEHRTKDATVKATPGTPPLVTARSAPGVVPLGGPSGDLPDYGPMPQPEPEEGQRGMRTSPPHRASQGAAPEPRKEPPARAKEPPSRPQQPLSRPQVPPRVARLEFAYQYLREHRLGGQTAPYHIGAVTFFPVASVFRLSCSIRFGMADGVSPRSYFLDALAGVGLQAREAVRGVTPFVEAQAGAGLRMYSTFHNTLPSLGWTFGAEAGVQLFLVDSFHVVGAVGWARPVVRIRQASGEKQQIDVYGDTVTVRLGVGF